jgi:mono-ADP-ribosyltransferase sirtuin 6
MSAGYASRLSDYKHKGIVGLPESYDSKRSLSSKLKRLCEWVKDSKHLVILTGAGISTSAGIPDFRGPTGIWTLEKETKKTKKKKNETTITSRKRKLPEVNNNASMDFSKAQPTVTHRAISKLASVRKLKYCITQNVDGLHRRAGLSRSHHAALHGCAFTEQCESCKMEYYREADVGGMSFQATGNVCTDCGGLLHDTLLDWEDALPGDDFQRAEEECDQADLVLCLGTSLRIEPVGSLPLRAKRFVIVNLQITPKDDQAAMILRANVDDVMDHLMQQLGYEDWKEEAPPPIEREWKPKSK